MIAALRVITKTMATIAAMVLTATGMAVMVITALVVITTTVAVAKVAKRDAT